MKLFKLINALGEGGFAKQEERAIVEAEVTQGEGAEAVSPQLMVCTQPGGLWASGRQGFIWEFEPSSSIYQRP